jgi:hypothetical protein
MFRNRMTNLDAPALMVHIMVPRIVPENVLQRIEWKGISAMIVDCLHSRETKEKHCAPDLKARKLVGHSGANGIHKETLEGMVVEGTKRVRNI